MKSQIVRLLAWVAVLAVSSCGAARGQSPAGPAIDAPAGAPADSEGQLEQADPDAALSIDQARIADRFSRLEQVALRLAELSAATDPTRARLLREFVRQSKDQQVDLQFESIVDLLGDGQLAIATDRQTTLEGNLQALLELLLKENEADRLEAERRRLEQLLRDLNRLIKQQQGVQSQTEGDGQVDQLSDVQGELADRTGRLAEDVAQTEGEISSDPSPQNPTDPASQDPAEDQPNEGQPSEGQPSEGQPSESQPSESQPSESQPSEGQPGEGQPSEGQPSEAQPGEGQPSEDEQPAQEQTPSVSDRLRQAQQRMEQAQQRLDQAQREGAAEEQQRAIEALQQAKAELERILRQLREEELEQLLAMLEARFRKMLAAQIQVYEGTLLVDSIPLNQRDQDDEIQAGRLSRNEGEIALDAERALQLLLEDGSSVAFPETVQQMREDMLQVAAALRAVDVGQLTQSIEQDIILALEEAIEALQKAQAELEQRRGQPPPPQEAGEPQDPALIDQLAELKMIRSLQIRVNKRTVQYGQLAEAEPDRIPEIIEALDALSEREARIHKATSDLDLGRNR